MVQLGRTKGGMWDAWHLRGFARDRRENVFVRLRRVGGLRVHGFFLASRARVRFRRRQIRGCQLVYHVERLFGTPSHMFFVVYSLWLWWVVAALGSSVDASHTLSLMGSELI